MYFRYTDRRADRTTRNRWPVNFAFVTLSIAVCLIVAPSIFATPTSNAANGPTRFFANTGHSVDGAFLKFYDAYGGIGSFGYPISDSVSENGRTVQYFERQRFEYHPEAADTPNEVQLSRLGAELAPAGAVASYPRPFKSLPDAVYFPESKHSLKSPFLEYWRANGNFKLFGYPVTEPLAEGALFVQYFERARMEYNPKTGAGSSAAVQLGLLGKQYLKAHPDIASRLNPDIRSLDRTSRGSELTQQRQADTSASQVPAPAPALSSKETQLLDLINHARQEQGLRAVSLNNSLRVIALSRSQDMITRGYFSHTTPDGANFLNMLQNAHAPYGYAGEIIANNNYDNNQTAQQAYIGFMNSPHHHEIMMDPHYTLAGVGEAANAKGFHYYTVIFTDK